MNRLLVAAAALVCTLILPPAQARSNVVIGVVTDGPMTELERAQALFLGEIVVLTEGEFKVQFPEHKQLDGAWSIDQIKASLARLQRDPEVDMVLALGFVSSLLAATSVELHKPTFAPLVIDANLFGLPRQGNSSGVRLLNYLTEELQFAADLKAFLRVVDFRRLSLVVDSTIFRVLPDLAERSRTLARSLGVELDFVTNDEQDEDLAGKIPSATQAVMVAALPRLSHESRQRFIASLIERKLPSFSLIGTTPVEKGLLMAVDPDSDWQRLARRNALNVQAVLLGGAAGDQPVFFRRKRQLTINMATARALGIYPSFDVLSEATLLNEQPPSVTVTSWSLSDVAAEALSVNLDVRASIAGVQAGAERVRESRSRLLPQANARADLNQLSSNSLNVQSGFLAERDATASVELSQIIYSESARAGVDVESAQQRAREAAHRTVELDIVQEATLAFLNVLRAKTFVSISQRELELTRTNLRLAQDRVRIGSANASDVYRWESQLANVRRDLLRTRAELMQAINNLNRVLRRPLDQRFDTVPATLDEPELLVSRPGLLELVDNERAFDLLGRLFIQQGLENSPELLQASAQIEAARRQLQSARRAYWSPDVLLSGQVTEIIEETRVGDLSEEGESDWRLNLNLSLPLYQGGARRARVSRSRYGLNQLELRRRATRDRVEQNIRTNLHSVRASFPAIELAQTAAIASRKSLELVRDNYSQGTVSLIELLDAQDTALDAQQNATNAVYDFLIDLMNLQRSVGEFDFFLNNAERDAAVEEIKRYISTGGPARE